MSATFGRLLGWRPGTRPTRGRRSLDLGDKVCHRSSPLNCDRDSNQTSPGHGCGPLAHLTVRLLAAQEASVGRQSFK